MRADCWALPVVSRPPLLLSSRVPRAYLLGVLSGLCAAGIGGWRFCSRASPRCLMHALILVAYTNKYGVFTEVYLFFGRPIFVVRWVVSVRILDWCLLGGLEVCLCGGPLALK